MKKNKLVWLGLIGLFLYLLAKILFWGSGSFYARYRSHSRLLHLEKQQKELAKQNLLLKERLEKTKQGDFSLEKVAREEYGLQKKGETVIKFIEPKGEEVE